MKKILITICLFLLAPSVGLAACYSASGFGTAGVDGTYTDSGTTFNGQIVYTNGNGKSLFAQDNPNQFWAIDNTGWTTGGVNYYNYQSPFSTPDTGTWIVQTGASPAGTITSVSCGGGTGTTTPDSLPNWIGLDFFTSRATSTLVDASTTVYEFAYSVNTTTQEMFNALTDHTQSNLAYGLGLFIIVAGGFLWTLRSRK